MMNDEIRQPKEYDLVLGNQDIPQSGDLVLGGIIGVKRDLKSRLIETRIAALDRALNYGNEGLDLIIAALTDEAEVVQKTAYNLLRDRSEKKVSRAILDFNPYRFLECICELKTLHNSPGYISFNSDASKLLYFGSNSSRWNPQTGGGGKVIRYLAFALNWAKTISEANLSDYEQKNLLQPDKPYFTYFLYGSNEEDDLHSLTINSQANTLIAAGNPKQDFDDIPYNQIELIELNNGVSEKEIYKSPINISKTRDRFLKQIFLGHSNWGAEKINTVMSRDNTIVATSSIAMIDPNQKDNSIIVWNVATGEKIHTLQGHTKAVTSLAIDKNDFLLISTSEDSKIKIWNIVTGENLLTIDNNTPIIAATFNPQNNHLIISDRLGQIKIYAIDSGKLLLDIDTVEQLKANTNLMRMDSRNNLDLLNINDQGTVLVARNRIGYSRESQTITLWNLITGKYLTHLNHYNLNSIAITTDGNTIASLNKNSIKLWQINL